MEMVFQNQEILKKFLSAIKYLILIREWFKESQKPIPDFFK